MASGILAQSNINVSNTWTLVYSVPSGKIAATNINICNYTSAIARVDLALSTQASTPLVSEYVEYYAPLVSFEVLERGGFILEASRKVYVRNRSDSANLAVTVTGYEE